VDHSNRFDGGERADEDETTTDEEDAVGTTVCPVLAKVIERVLKVVVGG
jgi:hypothetical protein